MFVTSYFYLHPEENQSILVKMLARFSTCFLTGIEESFTVQLESYLVESEESSVFFTGGSNTFNIRDFTHDQYML